MISPEDLRLLRSAHSITGSHEVAAVCEELEAVRSRIAELEQRVKDCDDNYDILFAEVVQLRAQGLSQEDREACRAIAKAIDGMIDDDQWFLFGMNKAVLTSLPGNPGSTHWLEIVKRAIAALGEKGAK